MRIRAFWVKFNLKSRFKVFYALWWNFYIVCQHIVIFWNKLTLLLRILLLTKYWFFCCWKYWYQIKFDNRIVKILKFIKAIWKILILKWAFLKILISISQLIMALLKISISTMEFCKLLISIKYRIDKDLANRTPLPRCQKSVGENISTHTT